MTAEDPMSHSGAKWCAAHGRWECAAAKPNHHASAIRGQAYCKHHVGKSTELAKAQGEANLLAWSTLAAADAEPLDLGRTVMDQLRLAVMRAELYGEMLRAQVARDTSEGLVGESNDVRGLVRVEASERDRVVRFAKIAHDMGIDELHIRLAAGQAERVVAAQQLQLEVLHKELPGGLQPALRSLLLQTFLAGLGRGPEVREGAAS